MFDSTPWLSLLIWWPIASALLMLLGKKYGDEAMVKKWALLSALAELLLCLPLHRHFNIQSGALQFQEWHAWIPAYGIHYALGIDGFSLVLILLTAFTTLIVVLASCRFMTQSLASYLASFFVAQAMMIGVFAARDAILFYVFWEAMLIPMFLSLGMWGGKNRSYAAYQFFITMFLGSVAMLIALLYLHQVTGSFDITRFYQVALSHSAEMWLFAAFFLAFALKLPLWPLHTWLLEMHTAAPAAGSVVLAALMLKIGIYGFIRFTLPIVPWANQVLAPWMMALGLIAIVYVGVLALAQQDLKKWVAYSSIAHMGFAVLGCFMIYMLRQAGNWEAASLSLEGAMVQMVAHAANTGGLFLAVSRMQAWTGSRSLQDWGGLAKSMPIFAAFFMLFALSNVGLPGTSGFVGEFMLIIAAFHLNFFIALLAATTLVIAAVYTLWMYKQIFFGARTPHAVAVLPDIGAHDIFIFSLLAAFILIIGFYPQGLLSLLHASASHLLTASWILPARSVL